MYDFNWRLYCPFTTRTQVPDPLAELFPWQSPYSFLGNNAVMNIDPDGRSHSKFDESGNYIETVKDNWFHNTFFGRTGRIVDGDGNVIQKFRFADPKNDVNDLKAGNINRIHFVQESEIISMLSKAGAFTKENKTYNNSLRDRYSFIERESQSFGKFDFAVTGIPAQYYNLNVSETLFLINGTAHNRFNFGNFLWGAGGRALGLTQFELQAGAHRHSLGSPERTGYDRRQFDSRDDQRSIRMGVRHANRRGYRNMFYRATVGH